MTHGRVLHVRAGVMEAPPKRLARLLLGHVGGGTGSEGHKDGCPALRGQPLDQVAVDVGGLASTYRDTSWRQPALAECRQMFQINFASMGNELVMITLCSITLV